MADAENPKDLAELWGIDVFTARWNALRGVEGAARTFIEHRGTAEEQIHYDGLLRAVAFLEALPSLDGSI